MKGRAIALGQWRGHEAAALIEDGIVTDFLRDGDAPRPGTIYRAIADRPAKGQGGIFVRTPDGNGFLRQIKGISAGGSLLVQVNGYAEPGKAIPVTARLLFKSRYAIITPGAPGLNVSRSLRDDDRRDALTVLAKEVMQGRGALGLILRSACETADDADIARDVNEMADVARQVLGDEEGREPEKLVEGDSPHTLAWRDWPHPDTWADDPDAFDHFGVLKALEDMEKLDIPLDRDGSICVEPTRALVAVDVNTGADGQPAAGLRTNIEAARALPRLLRLRGLGGQIVMDLAPMPKKDRKTFESALRASFRKDPVETALVGWTPLGHYELQRKRDRLPVTGGNA
ncbi:ribonuclease E/G [Roseovarius aestuariivivens]|uniref:ribonuclease E/G n=1 Tax=Roseovarius aestuariivivens TaxID=1888910 RepID=UPI001081833C|nr:ribonuclease E/G [Roseovarius aestuariivivens]